MCRGLRGHDRLKDSLSVPLEREYQRAIFEVERLTCLYRDVCWFNFETHCREWVSPWPESWDASIISLHGARWEPSRTNRESDAHGMRLVWYMGTIADAPHCPPEIIYNEIKDATEYLNRARDNRLAAYSYAPGGREYERLIRESEGVRLYEDMRCWSKSSEHNSNGRSTRRKRG